MIEEDRRDTTRDLISAFANQAKELSDIRVVQANIEGKVNGLDIKLDARFDTLVKMMDGATREQAQKNMAMEQVIAGTSARISTLQTDTGRMRTELESQIDKLRVDSDARVAKLELETDAQVEKLRVETTKTLSDVIKVQQAQEVSLAKLGILLTLAGGAGGTLGVVAAAVVKALA